MEGGRERVVTTKISKCFPIALAVITNNIWRQTTVSKENSEAVTIYGIKGMYGSV